MASQTIRAASKDKQQEMFDEMRKHGDPYEKQVVKYSQPEKQQDGTWQTAYYLNYPTGSRRAIHE